jgi:hypothetical protein
MSNHTTDRTRTELIKEPEEWKTGDDPATPAQRAYLETLATQANEPPPDDELTKAEASKRIDKLRDKTGLADR